jgi:hypothetical protein
MKLIYMVLLSIYFYSPFLFSQKDVKIGTQVWTSKDLDVSTFRNGEAIPQAKDKAQWKYASDNKIPAWCYYEFNENNGKKFGKLYNWYAVSDARGLAPKGYHVPTDSEWTILVDFLGGEKIAGKKMKSKDGWKSYTQGGKKTCPNCEDWSASYRDKVPCNTCKDNRYIKVPEETVSGNGDNSSGFNGLPGGWCNYEGGFNNIGEYGNWWSSTEYNANSAWIRQLDYIYSTVDRNFLFNKNVGFSVRCLRD